MDRKSVELGKKAFADNGSASRRKRVGSDRCPLLGLIDDPDTAFAYSTNANHCHNTVPAASVQINHQQEYCLSSNYISCPIFRRDSKVALPGRRPPLVERFSLSAPLSRFKALIPGDASLAWLRRYRVYLLAGWLALIAGALVLMLGWLNGGATADDSSRPLGDGSLAGSPPTLESTRPQATATSSRKEAVAPAGDLATSTPSPTPAAAATETPAPTTTAEPATGTIEATASATPTLQPTSTPAPAGSLCGPPPDWVVHTVQSGETLYRISLRYGVSLAQLRQANCLVSDAIYAGQRLYVPFTIVPSPTLAPTATPTPPPHTDEPATATSVPTPTATPMPSPTSPPSTATASPVPPTPTPEPTAVPVTATPLPSPTSPPPTATASSVPPTPTRPLISTPAVTRVP